MARKKKPKISFKRGSLARALRDVLAKRIAKDGSAREPFAVATSRIRRKGTRFWRRNLPKGEVNREWAQQKKAAKRAKK